jgi:hypothetical protein
MGAGAGQVGSVKTEVGSRFGRGLARRREDAKDVVRKNPGLEEHGIVELH